MAKRKKSAVAQTADHLAAIIEGHLSKLSPQERRKRINKAHDRVLRAIASRKEAKR